MKKTFAISLRSVLCSVIVLLSSISSYASHIVGADLYYTHISGNTYGIYVALYGDCGSTTGAFPTLTVATPQVCIYDGSTLFAAIHLSLPSPVCGTEITPLCPGDTSQCTSLTFPTPGINKFLFRGTITLPHTSTTWRFVYAANNGSTYGSWACPGTIGTGSGIASSSGRSAAITNLAAAGSTSLQLIDTLNNSVSANSSPDLIVSQQTFFCNDQHDEYDPTAVDPDADSLVFSLVPATNGTVACGTVGGAVSYTGTAWPGTLVSATEPLQVIADSFSINPATGKLIFHPNMFQRDVVTYNIREFRSGTLIGTSQREMTVLVVDCSIIFPCMFLPRTSLNVPLPDNNKAVKLYPNPATNELTINGEMNALHSLTITNTIGQVLLQQQISSAETKINISSLPPGLYYIALKGDNGMEVRKFVKM